jgi:hypothetical protein
LGNTVIELGFEAERTARRAKSAIGAKYRPELDGALVRVKSDDGARRLMDVLRALDGAGVEPVSLAVREPSLDDVFLTLTGHRAAAGAGDNETLEGAA